MRYGSPSIADAIKNLTNANIEKVYIMPLYPHYAMSSYETVVVKVMQEIAAQNPKLEAELLQPFYNDSEYINALVESAQPWLQKPYDALLFSFHGLPERQLRKSDPSHAYCLATSTCCERTHPAHHTCYRHQCYATVSAFAERAQLPTNKYQVSFQSRLGRDPWIQPFTDEVIAKMPARGIKKLLVICPAFVTDCLETLEEIAMREKQAFLNAGGEQFELIPCLNTHPQWINWMQNKIQQWLDNVKTHPKGTPHIPLSV